MVTIDTGGIIVNVYIEVGYESLPVKITNEPTSTIANFEVPTAALPTGELPVTCK